MRASTQFCTFLVDDLLIGVEVLGVQEVLRHQETTRVPLAPPAVRGLINLRGQIVPAIDLRRCLALPDRPPGVPPMSVVLRTDHGPVSLLVDEIGDVTHVDEDAFEEPPESLDDRVRGLLTGVYKLQDGLLVVLDVDALLALDVVAA